LFPCFLTDSKPVIQRDVLVQTGSNFHEPMQVVLLGYKLHTVPKRHVNRRSPKFKTIHRKLKLGLRLICDKAK
jgi:hypothetical protein